MGSRLVRAACCLVLFGMLRSVRALHEANIANKCRTEDGRCGRAAALPPRNNVRIAFGWTDTEDIIRNHAPCPRPPPPRLPLRLLLLARVLPPFAAPAVQPGGRDHAAHPLVHVPGAGAPCPRRGRVALHHLPDAFRRSAPSYPVMAGVVAALSRRLNRPLELGEVFSPDGRFPTPKRVRAMRLRRVSARAGV